MQGGNAAGTGGQGRFWIVSQNNQLQLGKAASSVPTMGAINITSVGSVGIGMNNPSAKLDVNGTTILRDKITSLGDVDFGKRNPQIGQSLGDGYEVINSSGTAMTVGYYSLG